MTEQLKPLLDALEEIANPPCIRYAHSGSPYEGGVEDANRRNARIAKRALLEFRSKTGCWNSLV